MDWGNSHRLVLAVCVDTPSIDIEEVLTNRTITAYDLIQEKKYFQAEDVLNEVLLQAKMSNISIHTSMYSSIRWSSWYHLRSVINVKLGNAKAAVSDLDTACKILESISDVNEIITCRYELVSLLVSYGDLDEALRVKSYLFELPCFGSDSWEYANKKYSQVDGKSLIYMNNDIDRLLHLVSLFFTRQQKILHDLQAMTSACHNATFYCNLCEFAFNITTSCKDSVACYNQVKDSLSSLLPTARFILQREILYKIDVINSLLSSVLSQTSKPTVEGESSHFLSLIGIGLFSLLVGFGGVLLFTRLSKKPSSPKTPSEFLMDTKSVKKNSKHSSVKKTKVKEVKAKEVLEKVEEVSSEMGSKRVSEVSSEVVSKKVEEVSSEVVSKKVEEANSEVTSKKVSEVNLEIASKMDSEVVETVPATPAPPSPQKEPIPPKPVPVQLEFTETPIIETPAHPPPSPPVTVLSDVDIPETPRFDTYRVTFSMKCPAEIQANSYYLLVRGLPSEFENSKSERITIGNRIIRGWTLESDDEEYQHTFTVTPGRVNTPTSPMSTLTESPPSLNHFKYRYAIRIKRRYSYMWYLSCWLVRDLMEVIRGSSSPDIILQTDCPLFPYMPGSTNPPEIEQETEIRVGANGSQTIDLMSMGSDSHYEGSPLTSPTPFISHQRDISTLSLQSQSTCVSNQSEDGESLGVLSGVPQGVLSGIQSIPQGVSQAVPQNLPQGVSQGVSQNLPQGLHPGMHTVPIAIPSEVPTTTPPGVPACEGVPPMRLFIPNTVPGTEENGLSVIYSTSGQPVAYSYLVPFQYTLPTAGADNSHGSESFAVNNQGVYLYPTPVDGNFVNGSGLMYYNPYCTVATENQGVVSPSEE